MPAVFSYRGVDSRGERRWGRLMAMDRNAALMKLERRGIRPTRLRHHRLAQTIARDFGWIRPRFAPWEVAWFFRNLASLLSSGLTLPAACELLADQRPGKRVGMLAADVQAHLERGASVSEAFERSGRNLGQTSLRMVAAGVAAGALAPTFTSIAELNDSQWRMRKSLRRAVRLPLVIMAITLTIFMFLIAFVLPKFENLYNEAGAPLPHFTRTTINISKNVEQQGWMIPIAVSLLIALVILLRMLPTGRLLVDRIGLKIPRLGSLARRSISARSAKTLGLMLRARVPILDALQLTGDASGNEVIASAFDQVRDSVAAGDGIGSAFARADSLPLDLRDLAAVGEASSDLSGVFIRYADEASAELELDTEGLGNTLEPFLVVVLGALIGAVIVAMYLPIFKLVLVLK